jgi:putative mRNA 3-end processing factor
VRAVRDLVTTTPVGLYCELGDFHIDPWRPSPRAIITHAHTDHARPGHDHYLTTPTGKIVLESRFGSSVQGKVDAQAYGHRQRIGEVFVTFFPAGHVLGSAQIRIERIGKDANPGETWVISGDYKTQDDGISEAFTPVRCDVFVTESTFGLPIYRWRPQAQIAQEINAWWAGNAAEGKTSLIACYALGKAQRVMAMLDPSIGPILTHGAMESCTAAYRASGIKLPATQHATQAITVDAQGKALVLAPPSSVRSNWAFNLVKKTASKELSSAMASGWMTIRGTRRRRSLDAGFALSDHVDWPGLLETIRATGASRIGVTHGSVAAVVRYLNEQVSGVRAFAIETQFGEEEPDTTGENPAGIGRFT